MAGQAPRMARMLIGRDMNARTQGVSKEPHRLAAVVSLD